jgi:hypothetical protein
MIQDTGLFVIVIHMNCATLCLLELSNIEREIE